MLASILFFSTLAATSWPVIGANGPDRKPVNSASILPTGSGDSFSIRSQIELYEDGHLKSCVRTLEQYSHLEARAVVELESIDKSMVTGDNVQATTLNNKVAYYNDAKRAIWLRTTQYECLESSMLALSRELYADEPPYGLLGPDTISPDPLIGGAARLLLLIELACPQFIRGTRPRIVRGISAIEFKCLLGQDGETSVEMLYAHQSAGSTLTPMTRPEGLPMWLNLSSSSIGGPKTRSFVLNFYKTPSPQQAPNITPPIGGGPARDLFMFPLGLGCGSVLAGLTARDDQKDTVRWSEPRELSFRARYLSTSISRDSMKVTQMESLYLAFNMRAKLLRRESLLLDHSMGSHDRAKSIAIYDLNRKRKYNFVSTFSLKARDYNYTLSNIVDEGGKSTECLSMDMEGRDELEFIKFERLQFMGRAQVEGVVARVYEDDNRVKLPFWLDPSVSVTSSEGHSINNSLSGLESKESITLVYYFADYDEQQLEEDGTRAPGLGQLLQLEVIVRDSLRKYIATSRRIKIFNFSWDRLVDSPSGVRTGDLFALSASCLANKLQKSLKLAMYLEFKGNANGERNPDSSGGLGPIENQWDRNEAVSETVAAEFQLPRTHLGHLVSSLTNTNQQTLPGNIWLEFETYDFDGQLKRVGCHRLGRGHFMGQARLMRSTALTFEDCFWFAHYCQTTIGGSEVVFAHDEEHSLCLVDRLHKMRDLKLHLDTKIVETTTMAADNKPKSLNYFPYQFGQYVMHTIVSYPAPTSASLRIKAPLNYIGRQVSLNFGDDSGRLDYIVKHVKISKLLNPATNASTMGFIEHLGWKQTEANDRLVKRVSSLRMVSYLKDPRTVEGGVWTEALCKSWCLVDIECKSYSFCERSPSTPAECLLSKLDIMQPVLAQQLDTVLRDSGIWRENKIKKVSLARSTSNAANVADSNTMGEVSVIISKRCSIYRKSYVDLFDRSYQMAEVDLTKQTEVSAVANEDKCAEQCFAKNLDYMRGIIRHKLDLDKIQRDLISMIENNQIVSASERLDLATNWHHRHLKSLCLAFMYAENGNSNKNPCILHPGSDKTPARASANPLDDDESDSSPSNTKPQPTALTMHRMLFSNLYERMYGFRLSDSSSDQFQQTGSGDNGDDDDDDVTNSILRNYTRWLEFHRTGHNKQILLATDDAEHCARACTLQTHGPRPSCSSFDYVYERTKNSQTGRKYCLLNSQSLHDFGRRGLLAQQVVYTDNLDGVQYWHFEPRDSLLAPEQHMNIDEDDDDCQLLGNILSKLGPTSKSDKFRAFKSISLVITLLGVVSGLFLGIGLARYWILYEENIDEITFKSRMIRTLHRLSGVSLSHGLQEQEVRM